MTTEKTYILVEIIHKGPLKKTVANDLPARLARAAYDSIAARGGDCEDVKAKQVEEPKDGAKIEMHVTGEGIAATCRNSEISSAIEQMLKEIPTRLDVRKSLRWEIVPHEPAYGDVLGGAFVAVRWNQ